MERKMPSAQKMVEAANQFWHRDNLGQIRDMGADAFSYDRVDRYLRESISIGNESDQDVLESFPRGLMASLSGLFQYNISLGEDYMMPIQFLWIPAYDWELRIVECPGRPGPEGSMGAISVLIKGRYPMHTHPQALPIG
jgi:hypothetical protein